MSTPECSIRFANLTRADGSAIMSWGHTVVQAAVFGPLEVAHHKEMPDKATVEVSFKTVPVKTAVRTRELSPEIKSIQEFIVGCVESVVWTELHPRTSIQIILQELENDGHLLSPAINCINCALLDSGLAMRCLMASSTAVIFGDGDIRLDPSENDIQTGGKSILTFVFESATDTVISVKSEGSPFTKEQFMRDRIRSRFFLDL